MKKQLCRKKEKERERNKIILEGEKEGNLKSSNKKRKGENKERRKKARRKKLRETSVRSETGCHVDTNHEWYPRNCRFGRLFASSFHVSAALRRQRRIVANVSFYFVCVIDCTCTPMVLFVMKLHCAAIDMDASLILYTHSHRVCGPSTVTYMGN
jgi:hypothetical protein